MGTKHTYGAHISIQTKFLYTKDKSKNTKRKTSNSLREITENEKIKWSELTEVESNFKPINQ